MSRFYRRARILLQQSSFSRLPCRLQWTEHCRRRSLRATNHGCGSTPNALWAVDLNALIIRSAVMPPRTVSLQASMGPTLADGTAYLVTGSGTASEPTRYTPTASWRSAART